MAREHFLRPMLASPAAAHRLVNADRGLVIATRVLAAFDSASRRTGLLGRTGLPEGDALIIAPCSAVHTFGMQFPIDVLFVDRRGRVLKRVLALRRRRIAACLRAFAVVECAAHHPAVARTEVGDVLLVAAEPQASIGDRPEASPPSPARR